MLRELCVQFVSTISNVCRDLAVVFRRSFVPPTPKPSMVPRHKRVFVLHKPEPAFVSAARARAKRAVSVVR
jgi:hypothetical protein